MPSAGEPIVNNLSYSIEASEENFEKIYTDIENLLKPTEEPGTEKDEEFFM